MAKRHATRRRVSAGAAVVTGLGTIGLGLFTAAPAQADITSPTLTYTCEAEVFGSVLDQGEWTLDLTVGVPEQVEPGADIPAPDITATVTTSDAAADTLRNLNVKSISGTSEATYTVGGEDRTASLEIPDTKIPESGGVVSNATGSGQAETAPSEDGEVELTAGDFTADLKTDDGNGGSIDLPITCTAPEDNAIGAIQVGEGSGDDGTEEPGDGTEEPGDGTEEPGDGTEEPGDGDEIEVNDWFDEPSSLPVEDNTFTVEGTADKAGTLIIQVLDGDHKELTSYTWDVEKGDVSNSFDLLEGADYVRILSQDCVDMAGDTEETPGSGCNVEYVAPWADSDKGGDTGDSGDAEQTDDSGDAEQAGDSGDAGQPQVPDVVQTDGGQLKGADSTNSALALGGLLLFGAGAGAVFAARRRAEQH